MAVSNIAFASFFRSNDERDDTEAYCMIRDVDDASYGKSFGKTRGTTIIQPCLLTSTVSFVDVGFESVVSSRTVGQRRR